jgi:hypothetical protein
MSDSDTTQNTRAEYLVALFLVAPTSAVFDVMDERITLEGALAHYKPRHAPRARFAAWLLTALYSRAPLLQGRAHRAAIARRLAAIRQVQP